MLTKLSFFAYLSGIQSYVLAPLDKIQGSKDTVENSTSFAPGGESDLINSSRQNWIALAPAASRRYLKKKDFFFSHCVEISIPLISHLYFLEIKMELQKASKISQQPVCFTREHQSRQNMPSDSMRKNGSCLFIFFL